MPSVDLLELFGQIEREAKAALDRLAAGEAKTGVAALQRIRAQAEDGKRWGEAQREGTDPVQA